MDDLLQSNSNSNRTMLLTTDIMLTERDLADHNAYNVTLILPTRAADDSESKAPPALLHSPYALLAACADNTIDGDPSNSPAVLQMPTGNDGLPLGDLTELMVHSGSECPGWNESVSYDVVHGTSQVEHFAPPQSLVEPDSHLVHAPADSASPVHSLSIDPDSRTSEDAASTRSLSPSFELSPGFTYTSQGLENVSETAGFSFSPSSALALDIASSPPSSSPSQIFSSSPFASSQASDPHDNPEPGKSESVSDIVVPEHIQNESDSDIEYTSSTIYDGIEFTSSHLSASVVSPFDATRPFSFGEHSRKTEAPDGDPEAPVLQLLTLDHGCHQVSPAMVVCHDLEDHRPESYPLGPLSAMVPPSQLAEPLETRQLHDANNSQQMTFFESCSSASPGITPSSSPLPPSSPPNQLSSPPTIPMDVDMVEFQHKHGAVPSIKFPQVYRDDRSALQSTIVGKRKREPEGFDVDSTPSVQNQDGRLPLVDVSCVWKSTVNDGEVEPSKKPDLPNPKRSTIASQKQQHRKLIAPFRSPVLKRPKQDVNTLIDRPIERGRIKTPVIENLPVLAINKTPDSIMVHNEVVGGKRHRTERAAGQFKSPLSADTSLKVMPSVRLTPNIQAQERKLQLLKRAVKVKRYGDEDTLEMLRVKWTEAGREVAWEVWDLVKDNASSDDINFKTKPGGRPSENGWGWDDKSTSDEKERNWGWDVIPTQTTRSEDEEVDASNYAGPTDSEEEDKKQDTLGTMLMQLGIAPETLGWNEEEENFE